MNRPRLLIILAVLLGSLALKTYAEEERPIQSVYAVEIGSSSILDTYLSPVKANGFSTALTGNWSKALPANPEHLRMHFDGRLQAYRATNHGRAPFLTDAAAELFWGMDWNQRLPFGIRCSIGGDVGLHGGGIVTDFGSNNPANADIWGGLAINASLSMPVFIGKLPVKITDNVKIPSLGVCWAPTYAEPYYEIWLGNHQGLAHCAWWGNRFAIDNLLSADLIFGTRALRLGYRFRCESQYIGGNNRQVITHAFVAAIVFNTPF